MKNIFQIVENILCSDTSSLRELAAIAGIEPEIMYVGADFRGLEISAEDRFLLRACGGYADAEVSGSIDAQLEVRPQDHPSEPVSSAQKISEIRTRIFERYFEDFIDSGTAHPLFAFIQNLLDHRKLPEQRKKIEADFIGITIDEMQKYWDDFKSKNRRMAFIGSLNAARFVFGIREFLIVRELFRDSLIGANFFETYNLQMCTGGFLKSVLGLASNSASQARGAFVSGLVERIDGISFELAEYLVNLPISDELLSKIIVGMRGLGLSENRKKIAAILFEKVSSAHEVSSTLTALSSSRELQRQFIFYALRSPYVEISVAALRACSEARIQVNNLEFGEILYGFPDFENRLRYAMRVERLLPATSFRIVLDELKRSATTGYQVGIVEGTFTNRGQ